MGQRKRKRKTSLFGIANEEKKRIQLKKAAKQGYTRFTPRSRDTRSRLWFS
jgi:hypothetical protein